MITRQKRKAPPGQAGQATGRAAGAGASPRSGTILPQIKDAVKCEDDAGAVHIVLRPGQRPQIFLDAMQESDALALLPLAETAKRLAALLEVGR